MNRLQTIFLSRILDYLVTRNTYQKISIFIIMFLAFELLFLVGDSNIGFINRKISRYCYSKSYELKDSLSKKAIYTIIPMIIILFIFFTYDF